MRRLVASLGLLAFANLVFVQSSGACPLSGGVSHEAQAASPSPEHAGHAMPVMSGHEGVTGHPDGTSPHAPGCLMVGPCVLMVDVSGTAAPATAASHTARVDARSEHLPASLTTAPDIPPPRA